MVNLYSNFHNAEISSRSSPAGVSTFQQRYIIWSMRMWGKVQRTHICTSTARNALPNSQYAPVTLPEKEILT